MLTRISLFLVSLFPYAAQSQSNDTLVFAVYRYADNDRIKNIEPFAVFFGNAVRMQVKVKSYNSVQELISGMKRGETDIVFINTFGYLLLREQSKDYEIAAALSLPDGTRSTYQTAIVSSKNSGIVKLEDLKTNAGKYSLLLVNPGSTSGNLIPRLKLSEIGLPEPDMVFKSVTYTKNHALTLNEVAAGKADLGAFGSEEYHKAIKASHAVAEKVNFLWESQPIQLGPVVFNKRLSKEIVDQLNDALLSLHQNNPKAFDAIKAGWTEAIPADKFEKVDEDYYNSILHGNEVEGMKIIKAFAQ